MPQINTSEPTVQVSSDMPRAIQRAQLLRISRPTPTARHATRPMTATICSGVAWILES